MTQISQTHSPRIFEVDIEHDGLRMVVAGVFIVSAIIGFLVLAAVIPAGAVNLLAFLGGVVIASGFTWLVEQQLKQRWPSGREIHLTPDALALVQGEQTERHIDLQPDIRLLYWHFTITRRTRVPKGWHMVAAAVHDATDDTYITVYTLMSPETFTAYPLASQHTALQKETKNQDESLRLAGEQRRLRKAESNRWHEGAEMRNEDFVLFVQELEQVFHVS